MHLFDSGIFSTVVEETPELISLDASSGYRDAKQPHEPLLYIRKGSARLNETKDKPTIRNSTKICRAKQYPYEGHDAALSGVDTSFLPQ